MLGNSVQAQNLNPWNTYFNPLFHFGENRNLFRHVQHFHDPMDYSPPGSSVHGISQVGILEWVTILFSKGSS